MDRTFNCLNTGGQAIAEDSKIGIEPASIARAITFTIQQPSDVAINEMIVPNIQEL